jgi:hypothetical protein
MTSLYLERPRAPAGSGNTDLFWANREVKAEARGRVLPEIHARLQPPPDA